MKSPRHPGAAGMYLRLAEGPDDLIDERRSRLHRAFALFALVAVLAYGFITIFGVPGSEVGKVDPAMAGGGRGQDGDGEREVEPRPDLAQVRRRQVGRDALLRELEAAVDDRRAHALARLAHRLVGQPDDRERGKPLLEVDLRGHPTRLDSVDGVRRDAGEHGGRR